MQAGHEQALHIWQHAAEALDFAAVQLDTRPAWLPASRAGCKGKCPIFLLPSPWLIREALSRLLGHECTRCRAARHAHPQVLRPTPELQVVASRALCQEAAGLRCLARGQGHQVELPVCME